MKIEKIPIKRLYLNEGQIEGLPKNPRFIKNEQYKKLVHSLKNDPEMLELRELGVIPFNDGYVVFSGNMRLRAIKELGYNEAPCKILPENTPPSKLRAYAIKDNLSYGEDDWELLGNEWDIKELEEWGMNIEHFPNGEIKEDDAPAVEDVAVSKLGEIYQLGRHRVMCGSATDSSNVEYLMGGGES